MPRRLVLSVLAFPAFLAAARAALPVVTVTRDDTVLTRSCRVVIPPGTVLADAKGDGVIRVAADDITVEFAPGSELRGAAPGTPWDTLRGVGIRVDGHRGVRLVGARVHGFFNGVVATRADGLRVEGGDFSDNYRQHLRSTPEAEDGADWLFPHHNDERKWRDEYGGAVCVEASRDVTVRGIRVRRGQNGIVLDRVDDSRVFDNDCSFLSGWGLALWRCNRDVIARNALDFCVRGHVEGVYNRGQDSAGILCFEQCSDNVFAGNSVTHGGDGFFGFAGREAIGEAWMEAERARLRRETGRQDVDALVTIPPAVLRDFGARGCNRNVIVGNDFSYAAAHGLEMTFSQGNVVAGNRFAENAICGIWGGYSTGTRIAGNEFSGNGGMAYGLERGAINMEHASGNRITGNSFHDDKCAIHLWWDDDGALLRLPGVAANDHGAGGNLIAANRFVLDDAHPFGPRAGRLIVLQLRDDGTNHLRGNRYVGNRVALATTNAVEFAVKPGSEPEHGGEVARDAVPRVRMPGKTRPVGARAALRGRDKILMDEWGPWDHEGLFVRPLGDRGDGPRWEVHHGAALALENVGGTGTLVREPGGPGKPETVRLALPPGLNRYAWALRGKGVAREFRGTALSARWDAVFFPWPRAVDPRTNLVAWRALAGGPDAVAVTVGRIDFPFGGRGPRDLGLSGEMTRRGPGADRFGMIARTRLPLPAGTWRVTTTSDDGVRVRVDGRVVLENWGWHGPTRDEATIERREAGTAEIEVEYFEIDGHAVLRLDLEPAG